MTQQNLYFFTGLNTYALSREVQRWKKNFTEKHGSENLLVLQPKDCTVSDILDAISVMPFIAEKRLVLMEGLPKVEKEDLAGIVASIHPQTVLLIVESKPDMRLGIVKELQKHAEMKSFLLLSDQELLRWVRMTAIALGSSITPEAEKQLLSIVGNDQWMLESELQKLAAASTGEIGIGEVESLAVPSGSQIIWQLTDLVGSRQPLDALLFFKRRIERGDDPYGMWTVLLSMIKNLTLIFAAVEDGMRDERAVAGATGLHFMQVKGLLPLAKSMSRTQVRSLVDFAADADIQLKSGGYHYSAEHQGEVVTLCERLILMTQKKESREAEEQVFSSRS